MGNVLKSIFSRSGGRGLSAANVPDSERRSWGLCVHWNKCLVKPAHVPQCIRCYHRAVPFRILTLLSLRRMAVIMDTEYYHDMKLCLVMQQKKKINFIH